MSTEVLHSDRLAKPLGAAAAVTRKSHNRDAGPLNPSIDPLTLKTLLAEAIVGVEQLVFALEQFPERPYIVELERIAAALRRGDVINALRLRDGIPWVLDGGPMISGLAVYEMREPQVRQMVDALTRALGRVKLYSRYGIVPKA